MSATTKSIAAVYNYDDEQGRRLYEVVRFEPKGFAQRVPDGCGGYRWNLNGVRRVPYRFPALLCAIQNGETIYVTEGEKDADNLVALGLYATTSAQGCGWKWTREFVECFRVAKRIVILPDCDEGDRAKGTPRKGREAAQERAALLRTVVDDVRLLDLAPARHDGFDVSDWFAEGHAAAELIQLADAAPRFGQHLEEAAVTVKQPISGRDVLNDVQHFIERYVVVSSNALLAVSLWVLHTHALDVAHATPYLHIHSPQRRCGKSRFLEVLSLLVCRAWFTARTSAAALIRKVSGDKVTLLLDETDAAFGGEKEYVEVLRSVLNAGNLPSGVATLCVGRAHDVCDFSVFGAKALAGIGRLPDTIVDRSISVEMKRRLPNEPVQRFRRRVVLPEADALQERIALWGFQNLDQLRDANPVLPDELSDRAQDGWEPLLAIADLCGVGDEAREAAIALAGSEPEPEDLGLRTLADLRVVFRNRERLASAEAVIALGSIEDGPYGLSRRGRDFDERELAKRLKPFRIRPEQLKIDGKNVRGYTRFAFEDTWERYLSAGGPRTTATNATAATSWEKRSENGSGLATGSGSEGYEGGPGSGVAVVAVPQETQAGTVTDEIVREERLLL